MSFIFFVYKQKRGISFILNSLFFYSLFISFYKNHRPPCEFDQCLKTWSFFFCNICRWSADNQFRYHRSKVLTVNNVGLVKAILTEIWTDDNVSPKSEPLNDLLRLYWILFHIMWIGICTPICPETDQWNLESAANCCKDHSVYHSIRQVLLENHWPDVQSSPVLPCPYDFPVRGFTQTVRLHTIDNVLKNWIDRVSYCIASRFNHLNAIIFHY